MDLTELLGFAVASERNGLDRAGGWMLRKANESTDFPHNQLSECVINFIVIDLYADALRSPSSDILLGSLAT